MALLPSDGLSVVVVLLGFLLLAYSVVVLTEISEALAFSHAVSQALKSAESSHQVRKRFSGLA